MNGGAGTPGERALLLAGATADPALLRERVAAAWASRPDLARAHALARRHGLVPLLAEALELAPAGAVSEPDRLRVVEDARRIARLGLALAAELAALARELDAAGIPFVAYKGPTLALVAYGSITRRRFRDLDLLVRPRDDRRARELLAARGYRPFADEWRSVRHLSHEEPFERGEGGPMVDLHRRVLSRELFPGDPEPLWRRLERVRIGTEEIPTFAAEDLLRILCEHAHKHRWERLGWLADVAHLIAARPGLDWRAVEERARRAGGAWVLGIGLRLAAERLAAPVPAATLARIAGGRAVAALAAGIDARLLDRIDDADERARDREIVHLQWAGRERWRDRVRLVATPNESDWVKLPLPRALAPLHYLVRPARVALKYLRPG